MIRISDLDPDPEPDQLVGKVVKCPVNTRAVAGDSFDRVLADHGANLFPVGEQPHFVGLVRSALPLCAGASLVVLPHFGQVQVVTPSSRLPSTVGEPHCMQATIAISIF